MNPVAAIIAAGGAYNAAHGGDASGGMQIELWQVINLIGAPMLAVLFARPVIDDLRAWITNRER